MNTNILVCIAVLVWVNSVRSFPCPRIITRAEWGARLPRNAYAPLRDYVNFAIIHHGTGPRCFNTEECKRRLRGYQNWHMGNNDWSDIGYNFAVGEDGNMYEGRGWNAVGTHAGAMNRKSIGIVVIGDFTDQPPNQAALDAVKTLLECATASGKLSPSYSLCGHRDVMDDRTCPGRSFYEEIQTWDHYNELNRC